MVEVDDVQALFGFMRRLFLSLRASSRVGQGGELVERLRLVLKRIRRDGTLRKLMIAGVILVGTFCTAIMVIASIWPTINRVETGRTADYPHLMPKLYQLDYDRVYVEALSSAREQLDWTLTAEDRVSGVITATANMPVTGWEHQITIKVVKRSEYVSRINVISEVTDSPGDLGHNARLIEGYFDSLDNRLGAADVQKKSAPES